jgi:quinoprotein glucose dehydrogenase
MSAKILKFSFISCFVFLLMFPALFASRDAKAQRGAAGARTNSFDYGGGPDGIRYSSLKQINRENVAQLRVAWTYDCDDGSGDTQTQPVVIDGALYGVTPKHKIIALDAATGKLLWRFDSGLAGRGPNRGVTYWAAGDDKRIFAAAQNYVYALDAATGKPIPGFGRGGRIDLREGLGRDPQNISVALTTPGVIYKDMLIVGGRTPESLPAPPGDIRAFDVRTGKLRWSFHTIPRPGEYGYDTWPKGAWSYTGSVNNWAGLAVDEKRGVVYVPTGSAASDFYGADRLGDNLFANTLLALDAATGKRIWHFQAVKHDLWDRDFPSPPSLVAVRRSGRTIDAVAQTTKSGHVYLFDRVNGKPLFPIEYQAYPASDVPGEVTAKTQPLPTSPTPFSRQTLTEESLTNRTPEARQWAIEQFRSFNHGGQFLPFRVGQETIIFPGFDGGAEWGGSAFDPETGLLYVNANEMAWRASLAENLNDNSGRQLYLRNCAVCHGDDLKGAPPLNNIGAKHNAASLAAIVRQGAGRMPAFPNLRQEEVAALAKYLLSGENKELMSEDAGAKQPKYRFTGYHRFLDPDGYPAIAPPWGTLNAINLNTGKHAWKVPLGEYPELAEKGLKDTGAENYGGPVVTAGGLVFIAATNFDRKFRAFDKLTGALLWETTLPMAGNATPATYQVGDRQFVVVHATGGKGRRGDPRGGIYMAFALPGTFTQSPRK